MANLELSETAFLIAWGRAQNPKLSQDPYAKHFLTPKGIEFSQKFVAAIYAEAPHLWCLRSRYIIEKLRAFEKNYPDFELINIGAGLTAYPFVLGEKVKTYEIEQQHVIDYKVDKIKELQNIFPKRDIHFSSADLTSDAGIMHIENLLKKTSKPKVVLFEGILPYLSNEKANALIELCSKHLPKYSQVLVHVFLTSFLNTKTLQKIDRFLKTNLGIGASSLYYFEESDLMRQVSLALEDHLSFLEINAKYSPQKRILKDEIIDERFFFYSVK